MFRKIWFILSLILISLLLVKSCKNPQYNQKVCELEHKGGSKNFPNDFQFGVSTAAYQIEGGWNEDGRGPSIWDTYTHQHPEMIADHSTGDIATDSYHKFDLDLEALKELKVSFYRFSISWTRILPDGDISSKNQKGIDYYNMVIDKLLENGIEPMVTMFHYDLPETFNLLGGFTNQLLIKYFTNYAKLLFETFGDRVKLWITFNEPYDYCLPGYGRGNYPPMGKDSGIADYLCMDTTLKAHAEVYRLYRADYFEQQKGKIGITLSTRFYVSKQNATSVQDRAMQFALGIKINPKLFTVDGLLNLINDEFRECRQKLVVVPKNIDAASKLILQDYHVTYREIKLGWLANPLFGDTGNYPQIMLDDIAENSRKEGRTWSRLISLSETEQKTIKNAADFLGLNYYSTLYAEEVDPPQGKKPSWEYDSRLKMDVDPKWKQSTANWLHCVPEGLEGLLNWIKNNFNNVEVIITENGWSDDGQLNDTDRIEYLKTHLQAVLNAINNGCNVTGYTHWSLIDNFEWQLGYTQKFGLYSVDMSSANKERVAKKSASYYKSVIASKNIPESITGSGR